MGLFESISPGDFELFLHLARIIIPVTSLYLWLSRSSLSDIFDRTTGALTTVIAGILAFWNRQPSVNPVIDGNEVRFHVMSKVDCPRGEMIIRKWLVSWKPVPEAGFPGSRVNEESTNGIKKIIYYDQNTGMTFNINTSIQPMGVKELLDGSIPDGKRNHSPGETNKTK